MSLLNTSSAKYYTHFDTAENPQPEDTIKQIVRCIDISDLIPPLHPDLST